ncbi:MAG: molecular chaperone HtpG [Alphaproteobacteria bacterium]|nr:molecular chaperone HtpG [Alphaproteobacteria bacterium]
MADEVRGETQSFQAEVGKLLHIVANALYSQKEVFLRELISNASDACDRLRYAALTEPALLAGDADLRIIVRLDKAAGTIAVIDNGIGMNRGELVQNLGTIARSGTAAFVREVGEKGTKDFTPIGQFGVGFYAAFMVADEVRVTSRRAGADDACEWRSDGLGTFSVAPANVAEVPRGTRVTLHLKQDAAEFLEPARLRHIVTTYSDHIGLPIHLDDGTKSEAVNQASALWTRPKKDVTETQYTEFYHHVAHQFDDPWLVLHNRNEGRIEYTNLLFIPETKPFDLFDPARRHKVKLYVRRVFITEDCAELLPPWLRFVRGVVDSEDLPLNISREMLQKDPRLERIRQGLVKRILGELKRVAEKEAGRYAAFWGNFGAVVKEGLYEDADNRGKLLELARFRSTAGEALVSLDDYVGRMRPGQAAIYYITGDSTDALARSPQLEGFRARGIEVLLLADPVDDFWLGSVAAHQEKPFRSATRADADINQVALVAEAPAGAAVAAGDLDRLIALLKTTLGDAVKDVRASPRLTDSAACLVADERDLDMHLERILRQHKRIDAATKRILEINPRHALVQSLATAAAKEGAASDARLADAAHMLLDQARILEGEPLPDAAAFARRLSAALARGLGG